MKIIPKFQQGGYSSFFTVFKPVQTQGSTATTKPASSTPQTTKSGDDNKITQKQLFDMIKDIDGLDNDMTLIASNLLNAFEMAELTGNESDISKMYMSSLIKMKIANTNKKEFYKTTDSARINGSINQPAISADGKSLVLQNKETGKIVEMSYKDYASNKDNYYMLTNSNLAYLRQKDPQYAFNNSILNILNNGMSFKLFQESVDKAKNALGTSTLEYNGLIDTRSQESALKGLQVLKGLSEDSMIQASGSITTQGLYSYKQFDKTQKEQINALMTYMKRVLPDNLKTWAQVQTGMVDENQALEALLIPYLAAGVSPEHKFEINQIKLTKGSSGDGSDGGSSNDPKKGFWAQFMAGTLGTQEQVVISPSDGTSQTGFMSMDGQYIPSAYVPEFDSNMSLSSFITKSKAPIKNQSTIMFGDKFVPVESLDDIAVVQQDGIHSVILPINSQGGVNFDILKAYNEAMNKLEDSGLDKNSKEYANKRKELFDSIELRQLLNSDGSLNPSKFGKFLVVRGAATHKVMVSSSTTQNSKDYQKLEDVKSEYMIDKDDNDEWKQILKSALNTEQEEYDLDEFNILNPNDYFGGYDHIYVANIFIPINSNINMAQLADDNQVKESKMYEYEWKLQNMNDTTGK